MTSLSALLRRAAGSLEEDPLACGAAFEGVVITGTGVHGCEKRDMLLLGEHAGYKYCGDLVAGFTTHLVALPSADAAAASAKLERAREWGIPCVTLGWLLDSVAAAALRPTEAYPAPLAVERREQAEQQQQAQQQAQQQQLQQLPKRPSSVASNQLSAGELAEMARAPGSDPQQEQREQRPALQALSNRLRTMSISPQPAGKVPAGSPQQSLSFQGMLHGAGGDAARTPQADVTSRPPPAGQTPTPDRRESPMQEGSPSRCEPAQRDAFWSLMQGAAGPPPDFQPSPSPLEPETAGADLSPEGTGREAGTPQPAGSSGGAGWEGAPPGEPSPPCSGGMTPASQATVQARSRDQRQLQTPATVRDWSEDEEGGGSDCGPPTTRAADGDVGGEGEGSPASVQGGDAGHQPAPLPSPSQAAEPSGAREQGRRDTQPQASMRDWSDDGSSGGSEGCPTPQTGGAAWADRSGLTQRDPASIVVSRPAAARLEAGQGGGEVAVGRLLARPPRGSVVRELHGLKALKGVTFAEQVHLPAVGVTLSTKEKKTAARLRLPVGGGSSSGEGGADADEEEEVLAEPQALYCLPDGTWHLEFHRLLTGAQAEALVLVEGPGSSLRLPAGFDRNCEYLRSVEREAAPLAAVHGSATVRKLRQAGPILKLQGSRTHATALFWRCAVDISAGTVLTDGSSAHVIA